MEGGWYSVKTEMHMKNVLMSATSYPASDADWRGRFIYDMADSLSAPANLKLSLWAPPGRLPAGVSSALAGDDARWLEQMLGQGGIAHLLRREPVRGVFSALGLLRRLRRVYRDFSVLNESPVAHINWIQNALPLVGTRLPALITVLGSDLALLRLPGMVAMIRAVLRGRAVIFAPNAEWMAPMLQKYFGDLAEIRPIPFGVHRRWFAIERTQEACASGNWLMVSRVTRAKLGHLLDWGEGLFGGQRKLHLLGPMQERLELPTWLHYHGATNPEVLARDWFPQVAGLVTLSTHDEGRPQVMIEAMAAGLPVVATDLPAHRDLLRDGETGYLVNSAQSLHAVMAELDDPHLNRCRGAIARHWVAEAIGTWDDCARRYISAYEDLLERA